MIIKTEQFQQMCKLILDALDENKTAQLLNDSLEIKAENKTLCLNVTNREYYVTTKQSIDFDGTFRAVVFAPLFLNFISKVTTEEIEFTLNTNSLVVKANGNYKFPLIFDVDKMVELPPIDIKNPTLSFDIDASKLLSIVAYNKKELDIHKESVVRPVQKMYYLDEQGCATFTSGACVNNFTLPQPIKVLLPGKIVKLFKLFKAGDVKLTLGIDSENNVSRQKIRFENPTTTITAILVNDKSLSDSFPIQAIRALASKSYPLNVNISRNALIETITRLQLFMTGLNAEQGTLEFKQEEVVVLDRDGTNKEVIPYINTVLPEGTDFKVKLDLNVFKATLESCVEQHVALHFGDNKAIVISRGNVKNVIPQLQ